MSRGLPRIALIVALVLCALMLARWALLSDDAVKTPARIQAMADDAAIRHTPSTAADAPAPAAAAQTSDPSPSSGTLRGRVIDAGTHEPVRQFELAFYGARSLGQSPGTRTFRADDGRFEWRRIPAGTWTVTASARGYQRFVLGAVEIPGGGATPEVVLPLRRGLTLRGRVYDAATGAGIAAASIAFRETRVERFASDWRMRVHVSSKQDGSFVLEGVPAGPITLSVSARNYAERELNVVAAAKTAPVEIGLSAGGTIAGQLTAADGATPVKGTVGLMRTDEGFGTAGATGEGGEFSFQHLPAGRYQLSGQSGGRSVQREIVLADNEHMEGIVLALGAGRSIRGMVTGLRPEELERVSISVQRDEVAASAFVDIGVDARGAYVLDGVQPGAVRVVADVAMRRQIWKQVQMPADSDLVLDLEFPRGARLYGQVTRAGKPLPHAEITPRSSARQDLFIYSASTSAQGRYSFDELPPGEYSLRVGGYRSRPIQVAGDTEFDIDVPAAGLGGRVLEAVGDVPVVGAQLDLWSVQPGAAAVRLYGVSDHFGQFVFVGLEPGEFMLTAYRPGYEMYRERIGYGAPGADTIIRLRPARGVAISVREADSGKALQTVRASEMLDERRGSTLQISLDENGIGYIPSALAGSTLRFSAAGHAPVVIRAWNGQELDLQLARASR